MYLKMYKCKNLKYVTKLWSCSKKSLIAFKATMDASSCGYPKNVLVNFKFKIGTRETYK